MIKLQYKQYLLEGTMGLPLQWHTDHHSGDTIDKVEKGTNALYNYADQGFVVIKAAMRLIISFIALVYFSPISGIIAAIMIGIAFYVTLHYDTRLKAEYKILNHSENKASAQVYDGLSNIITVIILRIEKLVQKEVFKTIHQSYPAYKNSIQLNEIKWCIVNFASRILLILTLTAYIVLTYRAG